MRSLLLITLCLISLHASAGVVVGLGLGTTTKYETKEETDQGKDRLDFGGGFSIGADMEMMFSHRISLSFSGVYRKEAALTQYETNFQVPDVDTTATTFAASIGPRIRFLDFGRLRVLAGGGYTLGKLTLDYDRSDYVNTAGSDAGFDKQEASGFSGYYYEGGIEFILTKENALRLMGRETRYQTASFETMGSNKLNITQTQFFLQYLQYLNF